MNEKKYTITIIKEYSEGGVATDIFQDGDMKLRKDLLKILVQEISPETAKVILPEVIKHAIK